MRVVKRSDDARMCVNEGPIITRDDMLLRVVRMNACQGRAYHNERRHAFARRLIIELSIINNY